MEKKLLQSSIKSLEKAVDQLIVLRSSAENKTEKAKYEEIATLAVRSLSAAKELLSSKYGF